MIAKKAALSEVVPMPVIICVGCCYSLGATTHYRLCMQQK
ncbi:MAG: hypothetical protein ACLUPK_03050 [Veillonella sp.]